MIDDEEQVRKVIGATRARRYDVAAWHGGRAVEAVRETFFDLVITDILLPEKNGIELIADLDKEMPGLKFIAISGGGQIPADLYLESARNQGAAVSLMKPFDRTELIDAVRKLIG